MERKTSAMECFISAQNESDEEDDIDRPICREVSRYSKKEFLSILMIDCVVPHVTFNQILTFPT